MLHSSHGFTLPRRPPSLSDALLALKAVVYTHSRCAAGCVSWLRQLVALATQPNVALNSLFLFCCPAQATRVTPLTAVPLLATPLLTAPLPATTRPRPSKWCTWTRGAGAAMTGWRRAACTAGERGLWRAGCCDCNNSQPRLAAVETGVADSSGSSGMQDDVQWLGSCSAATTIGKVSCRCLQRTSNC